MPRVAVLGGGSGLAALLAGLKVHTPRLTAVVTVTDEGGSSGRLRKSRGTIPPGDLRHCLTALAEDGALLSRLFEYRFPAPGRGRDALAGHAFGNLFLTALSDVAGGWDKAMEAARRVLAVRGRVLPASLEPVRLAARLADGRRVVGETRVSRSRARIRRVALLPAAPSPAPGVLEALRKADLIVLGPGSLYTSVLPPLLVKGVLPALAKSRAPKVYVCNLMTQPGETDGYGAADHLEALLDHGPAGGRPWLDAMLVNDEAFPARVLRRYGKSGAAPVTPPRKDQVDGVRVVRRSLAPDQWKEAGAYARHSSKRLAAALMGFLEDRPR